VSEQIPAQEITADDLRRLARVLGLVPVPEHLMARVLESVRSHRAQVRRFDESGLDVGDVVTAQPYRV
jgi:hypothetical protein